MLELDPDSSLSTAANPGQLSESSEAPNGNSRSYGILVVDDEPSVLGMLKIAMRQLGFAVWLACNGLDALDLYRRHRAVIDVVLMDVRMPGWDGPETLAALQQFDPLVRCCFMSADLGAYSKSQLANLGAAAVFGKPFALATVGRVIRGIAQQAYSTT